MSPALDGGALRKPPGAAELPQCVAMVTNNLGANIGDTRRTCGRPAQFQDGGRSYCYGHWPRRGKYKAARVTSL